MTANTTDNVVFPLVKTPS